MQALRRGAQPALSQRLRAALWALPAARPAAVAAAAAPGIAAQAPHSELWSMELAAQAEVEASWKLKLKEAGHYHGLTLPFII